MNTGHAQLIDPVCGMSVTDRSAHRAHYGAGDYYFCSASCRTKFTADPARYVDVPDARDVPTPSPAPPVAATTIYTCPMHPQIRTARPGYLPDLRHGARATDRPPEPKMTPRLRAVRKKFWIATAARGAGRADRDAAAPAGTAPGSAARARALRYAELLLTTPVVLWAGADYLPARLARASSIARQTCTR